MCDGLNVSPSNIATDGQNEVQTARGTRWKSARQFDRLNSQITVTFDVYQLHDNVWEAEDFILTHAAEVPTSGLVEFKKFDGSSVWLDAAVCKSVNSKQTGRTTWHSYVLVGGRISKTKP